MSSKINPESKKAIQPFVPVGSDERTELYSHRELVALARMDPRNELDELSEPQRFRKDVMKPEGPPPRGVGLLLSFLAGAALGGVLMALASARTERGRLSVRVGSTRRGRRRTRKLLQACRHEFGFPTGIPQPRRR